MDTVMINRAQTRRRGLSTTTMVAVATAGVMVVSIAWMVAGNGSPLQTITDNDIFMIEQGGFDISIPVAGDLTSLDVVEIRNELEGTSTIMELIPEGSTTTVGELLLKLDDEPIRKLIESESEQVTKARNQLETAISDLEIAQKRRETNIAQAQLKIDIAELSLEAWINGEVVSLRKKYLLDIETAEKDYHRLLEKHKTSIQLKVQEFISQDELDQDEISMIRAKSSWEQATLASEVYEKYNYKKDQQLKQSDLDMAKEEYDRIVRREDATVRGSQSNVEAFKEGYKNRTDRLVRYKEQMTYCEVKAPAPGLVVYGSSVEEWRDDKPLRVGTKVSRNELLFILPNNSNMAAKLSVNEALSGYVKTGQRATVIADAIPDVVLEAEVIGVGVLAEDGGWRDPNRREYTISVRLDGEETLNLKPSMRCKGRIYIDRVDDVLFVPVHAIGREGMTPYVWIASNGGYEQRAVQLGQSSELFVVITDGVNNGERILLREPAAGSILSRLNEQSEST
jgi:HlyD family secretion protein